jgi:hypothetical protein
VVFFPVTGGDAIAPPSPETTQKTWDALLTWATGLRSVYLVGALERALGVAHRPPALSRLDAAEYEALQDAEQLETAATVARTIAKVDAKVADLSRAEAESLRRDRLAAEEALAGTEEAAATAAAELHEQAAQEARGTAAKARVRRRAARSASAKSRTAPKRGKRR